MTVPRSLQGRLLLAVLGALVLAWAVTAFLIWRDARHQLDELLDGHLAQAAALVAVQQGRELGDDDFDPGRPDLPVLAPKVAFQVWNDGEVVLRSASAPRAAFFDAARAPARGFRNVTVEGVQWRVFATHGSDRDDHDLQVYVAERVDSRQAILWAVMRGMLWPALLVLPLVAAAVGWSVHHFVTPLRVLRQQLAGRPAHAAGDVMVAAAPSELVPVVQALNGLFARIGSLLDSERRFTADAAHELRTPIAAIRAQAQLAMVEPQDAPRREALVATVASCDRAAHLVEQLLTLSRLEAEALPAMTPVDLVPLVRTVLAGLAPRAIGKEQVVEFEDCGAAVIRGDATLLAVLVRNLVDNALRYCPAGASLQVCLSRSADGVLLCIEDSGPGMAAEDLARIGERFFRVLGSGEQGSGLGWSIVQRVAAAHRAEVQVGRSVALGGLRVAVTWPA